MSIIYKLNFSADHCYFIWSSQYLEKYAIKILDNEQWVFILKCKQTFGVNSLIVSIILILIERCSCANSTTYTYTLLVTFNTNAFGISIYLIQNDYIYLKMKFDLSNFLGKKPCI